VFGELRGLGVLVYAQVIGGSVMVAAGAAAIAFSSAPPEERERWQAAAMRESKLYGTDVEYVRAGLEGRAGEQGTRRTALDWALLAIATLVFVVLGTAARAPMVPFNARAAAVLLAVIVAILAFCGTALWRTTKFSSGRRRHRKLLILIT